MAATAKATRHPYRWLLVLPFIWQLALAPAVNNVRYAPFNIPFPMLWQLLGVVFASVVIGVVFWLDQRSGVAAEEDVPLDDPR
ncbi:DUF3311 domain-containing protein [Fodinicola feengrottensis]|uniref:DUF3311 domain-containing protein n=1 Tax=Fodinicola feengrottensis TaxID=435914 RepID=A0ABP4U1B4_9ACTN|nr:DUF3311 domain-containing protein [Fodinicola feengrottensis]